MLVSSKADLGGDVFKHTFYNVLWWSPTNKSSSVIITPCIRTTIYQCQNGQYHWIYIILHSWKGVAVRTYLCVFLNVWMKQSIWDILYIVIAVPKECCLYPKLHSMRQKEWEKMIQDNSYWQKIAHILWSRWTTVSRNTVVEKVDQSHNK